MGNRRKFSNIGNMAKNVSIVFVNNVITLLKGLLVSFMLPKILSMPEYSEYKIFALYISYVGLFHFGLVDGICVRLAGKTVEEIGESRIRMYTRLLLILEVIISAALVVIAGFLVSSSYYWIVFFVALYTVIHNMHMYILSVMQITMQFKKYTYVGVMNNVVQLFVVLILWMFSKFEMATGNSYIALFIFGEAVTLAYSMIQIPNLFFGGTEKIRENYREIRDMLAAGIPLLAAGIVATLILNIGRQFVSALYSKEDYAIYAFTYSITQLITTLISALSIVLYPSLKKSDEDTMRDSYGVLTMGIAVMVFGVFVFSPVLDVFIKWFLPQYEHSLVILDCIFPSMVTISILQIVIVNYYKALEKTTWYLCVSIGALLVSFLLNVLGHRMWGQMEAIALVSVVTCFLWYIASDIMIRKKLGIKKGVGSYVLILTLAYTGLSLFVQMEKHWISDGLYAVVYIVYTALTLYKWKKVR